MNANLDQALQRAVQLHRHHPAVIDGDTRLSFGELERRVGGLAAGLIDLGLRRGDVVAVLSANSHRHLECWLGIPRAGLVLNDLNTRLATDELAFILDDCRAAVLVVDDAFRATGVALQERCTTIRHLVYAADGAAPDGLRHFDDLAAGAPAAAANVERDTLAGIFYTGGTTGLPKGAMLTHENLTANAQHTLLAFGYGQTDRYLHAGPMFHLADGASTFAITWIGGTHVIVPGFDPVAVAATIEREQVTHTLLVPTMINMLVHHPAISEYDLSSLRRVYYGGSPMPAEVQRRGIEIFGADAFVQGYGMTEAAPTVCLCTGVDSRAALAGIAPHATRLRSAGRPIVGVEAEIRRTDGTPATIGEVGEIWVRGRNVMAGYWQRPAETKAALPGDGWYRTGDAARADADGYLYIVDRVKDMIITGGENVYSTEVENALYAHPAVLEATVFGIPDPNWGERVHATVVPTPGSEIDPDELDAHCRARIAAYKIPRSYDVRHEPLPKSGAGKILKRELREPYWAERLERIS